MVHHTFHIFSTTYLSKMSFLFGIWLRIGLLPCAFTKRIKKLPKIWQISAFLGTLTIAIDPKNIFSMPNRYGTFVIFTHGTSINDAGTYKSHAAIWLVEQSTKEKLKKKARFRVASSRDRTRIGRVTASYLNHYTNQEGLEKTLKFQFLKLVCNILQTFAMYCKKWQINFYFIMHKPFLFS